MPPASSTTLKRIHREIADLKKEELGTIKLGPSDDNLFHWTATIPGPEGSVYEGGVFNVDIILAADYPFSAPHMTFRTRIYHMNISERGGICIDILKHNWSPALSLFKVILSLSSLLTDPNPKDPLVPSIATEYVRNRTKHDSTAREWTRLYAKPPPPPVIPPAAKASVPNAAARPNSSTPVPSTRPRGKARASTTAPPNQSGSSSSSTSAASPAGSRNTSAEAAIEINDSDDERVPQTRSVSARTTRQSSTSGVKRKRGPGGDQEVDIDLAAEEDAVRASARRRTDGSRSASGSSRTNGDVIVIED